MQWHEDKGGLGSGERGVKEGPDRQDHNDHVGQRRQWRGQQQCTIVLVRIVPGRPVLHDFREPVPLSAALNPLRDPRAVGMTVAATWIPKRMANGRTEVMKTVGLRGVQSSAGGEGAGGARGVGAGLDSRQGRWQRLLLSYDGHHTGDRLPLPPQ
jgi:hypothetical protein